MPEITQIQPVTEISETPAEPMTPEQIEISAMHNEPLPAGLELPEQLLFMSFRALHESARTGQITREQARAEKNSLLSQFKDWMRWSEIYHDTCRIRNELAGLSKEVATGGCDKCKQIMRIFDGRKS